MWEKIASPSTRLEHFVCLLSGGKPAHQPRPKINFPCLLRPAGIKEQTSASLHERCTLEILPEAEEDKAIRSKSGPVRYRPGKAFPDIKGAVTGTPQAMGTGGDERRSNEKGLTLFELSRHDRRPMVWSQSVSASCWGPSALTHGCIIGVMRSCHRFGGAKPRAAALSVRERCRRARASYPGACGCQGRKDPRYQPAAITRSPSP